MAFPVICELIFEVSYEKDKFPTNFIVGAACSGKFERRKSANL
jgi:hypothetical protein